MRCLVSRTTAPAQVFSTIAHPPLEIVQDTPIIHPYPASIGPGDFGGRQCVSGENPWSDQEDPPHRVTNLKLGWSSLKDDFTHP